jgi:dolichyl-diphosphooligosaccharide--protein glycosyltransferase/undecaprenyl-diphosphooligosaccharide--protein glycosyltransferase
MSGIIKPRSFFYKTTSFRDNGSTINLGNNIVLYKKQAKLKVGNQTTSVGNFIVTYYDRLGKLKVKRQKLNPRSNINIIYMKSSHQFLVVDNKTYNSTYFQLFILENYDRNLYEPVILTPLAKVYKLKI